MQRNKTEAEEKEMTGERCEIRLKKKRKIEFKKK